MGTGRSVVNAHHHKWRKVLDYFWSYRRHETISVDATVLDSQRNLKDPIEEYQHVDPSLHHRHYYSTTG